jgi:hypothetical protein
MKTIVALQKVTALQNSVRDIHVYISKMIHGSYNVSVRESKEGQTFRFNNM